MVNRNAPLAVRGTRLAIRKGLGLPLYEAELLAEAFRERVLHTDDSTGGSAGVPREARARRGEPSEPVSAVRDHPSTRSSPTTASRPSRSNRPEVLNAFDRQMCEEVRDAWHVVKADDAVNAVVLRAAGDRAFSAGLDTTKSFGQPDVVWNHDDPGELLSPKWQKCWKPVVCAVHGMCTAGAFYFVNEADVVICSDDATFFDSHVTYGSCRRSSRSG